MGSSFLGWLSRYRTSSLCCTTCLDHKCNARSNVQTCFLSVYSRGPPQSCPVPMTCYGLGAEADGDTRVGFLAGFIPPSCLFVYTGPIGLTGLPWTVICIIIIIIIIMMIDFTVYRRSVRPMRPVYPIKIHLQKVYKMYKIECYDDGML